MTGMVPILVAPTDTDKRRPQWQKTYSKRWPGRPPLPRPFALASDRHTRDTSGVHTMPRVPGAVLAACGLVGGYGVARWTKRRELGGVVLAGAGALAAREWHRSAGTATTAALTGAYVAGFAGSHPLARRLGAWPSVLTVAAAVAATSWLAADRRA